MWSLSPWISTTPRMSAELRTPPDLHHRLPALTPEEAEETGLTGTNPHAVSVAQRNSERLLRLVSDLLATAPRAAAAGVELTTRCAPALAVHADPVRLAMCWTTCSNTIKRSQRKPWWAELRAGLRERDNQDRRPVVLAFDGTPSGSSEQNSCSSSDISINKHSGATVEWSHSGEHTIAAANGASTSLFPD